MGPSTPYPYGDKKANGQVSDYKVWFFRMGNISHYQNAPHLKNMQIQTKPVSKYSIYI